MKKKLLSILLSLAMVITMMPMMTFTSFAAEANAQTAIVMLKAKAYGNNAVKLSWTKAETATKYVVYGNKCGSDEKKLTTVKSNSYTVKKIGKTKLVANEFYKFKVVAYNESTKLATSKTIHFITGKTSGKYANASKITATTAKLTLEVGQTAKVGATVKIYKNKKHIPSNHGSKLRYVSDNKAVATVSSKGEVQAISEGTAAIYIQDAGGLYCKTVVNVEDNRDREAFESYKQEVIAKCEALSKLTDTKGIKTMIADAKAGIESLTYDKTLTLEENKAAADAVYTNLVEKVKTQRIKQGLTLAALTAITGIIIHEIITPDPGPTPVTKYTVKFDMMGHGTALSVQRIVKGGKVKRPTNPTAAGYTFGGWYKEKACTNAWDFDTDTVTANTTLCAMWTANATVIPSVDVNDGKIKIGEIEIEINNSEGNEQELTLDQTTALAQTINSMLRNKAVASLDNTNLVNATGINEADGLSAIVEALKEEAEGDDIAKENIGGKTKDDIDLQIKVELSNVNVDREDNLTITYMEFDVTPIATVTVQNSRGETVSVSTKINNLEKNVQFRLPIGSGVEGPVAVYHKDTFLGNYKVKGEGESKYIEIESDNFSKYGYQIVNESNAGAEIEDTLYFKFEDAVASVKNNEIITLLKPANPAKDIVIGEAIVFQVDKNGENYTAAIKASDGYTLSSETVNEIIKYSITVSTVVVPVTGVTLDKGEITLPVGDEDVKLTATVLPENATDKSVTWTSSNESVATVDSSGNVHAVATGEATITVTTVDGSKTATCAVKVTAAPTFKAVYDTTNDANTLTFYYDAVNHSGEGTVVYENGLFDNSQSMGKKWGYNSVRDSVKNVVIDESVKNYDGLTSTAYMFFNMTKAQNIKGAENLDVSNVKDMTYMFFKYGGDTTAFTEVPDVSKWITSSVEIMDGVFYGYAMNSKVLDKVPDVSKWITSNVTSMDSLFNSYGQCSTILNKVPTVSEWDTSKVTVMQRLFYSYAHDSEVLTEVPDVEKWKTGSVTNMSFMFNVYGHASTKLNDVPNVSKWDTLNVENMKSMFDAYGYTSKELMKVPVVSAWNTSSVKQMEAVFRNYGNSSDKLKDVPDVSSWKTTEVTTLKYMLNGYGESSLQLNFILDLSDWSTDNVTDALGMFLEAGKNTETWSVTIPAKTGSTDNKNEKWYVGDGTDLEKYISPPSDRNFTFAAPATHAVKFYTYNYDVDEPYLYCFDVINVANGNTILQAELEELIKNSDIAYYLDEFKYINWYEMNEDKPKEEALCYGTEIYAIEIVEDLELWVSLPG